MRQQASNNLVDQTYWDRGYDQIKLDIADPVDTVRQWIERQIPRGMGSCFEVGCFPGRYLAVFGELGYELHGLDRTPRVETELPLWLKSRSYKVGRFFRGDFFSHGASRTYDIVCSFGFIEHFRDWECVLAKHSSLVNRGGCLVVAVPNFSGSVQRFLHRTLDRANYDLHHVPAMDPARWGEVVRRLGFSILYTGYFGRFDFWTMNGSPTRLQHVGLSLLFRNMRLLRKVPEGLRSFAPYCGMVARRR